MSLTAAAERLRAERAAALNRCPVGTFVRSLPDDDAKALDALFRNEVYSAEVICAALKDEGYSIPFDKRAVQAHRRPMMGRVGCQCPV